MPSSNQINAMVDVARNIIAANGSIHAPDMPATDRPNFDDLINVEKWTIKSETVTVVMEVERDMQNAHQYNSLEEIISEPWIKPTFELEPLNQLEKCSGSMNLTTSIKQYFSPYAIPSLPQAPSISISALLANDKMTCSKELVDYMCNLYDSAYKPVDSESMFTDPMEFPHIAEVSLGLAECLQPGTILSKQAEGNQIEACTVLEANLGSSQPHLRPNDHAYMAPSAADPMNIDMSESTLRNDTRPPYRQPEKTCLHIVDTEQTLPESANDATLNGDIDMQESNISGRYDGRGTLPCMYGKERLLQMNCGTEVNAYALATNTILRASSECPPFFKEGNNHIATLSEPSRPEVDPFRIPCNPHGHAGVQNPSRKNNKIGLVNRVASAECQSTRLTSRLQSLDRFSVSNIDKTKHKSPIEIPQRPIQDHSGFLCIGPRKRSFGTTQEQRPDGHKIIHLDDSFTLEPSPNSSYSALGIGQTSSDVSNKHSSIMSTNFTKFLQSPPSTSKNTPEFSIPLSAYCEESHKGTDTECFDQKPSMPATKLPHRSHYAHIPEPKPFPVSERVNEFLRSRRRTPQCPKQ